ncbi:MAG: polyprenyl synthetase family protein [Candidatus Methylomirabilis oxygeniifera]|uniref:Putative Geranyltranstransferase (Farnesyl-diphosphate synthase) (FPP synthase) n=1 Tax=Methylomirabilis oxygeniifera TaxID=671143 RepID=D5MJ49_METO1|nr:MAG: polyprenyl synthetase family protein [Candidatus Methylomirabilis oxyfera]CBE67414.1 Putative Geranyltranstransferase (Farnesyl-diphosphate synthase) (FPP synthase) [Candidatus Methylomirabilis oxyfera]
MTPEELRRYLDERRLLVDEALEQYLPQASDPPKEIHEAVRYSVFAGGKRLRPILILAATEAAGGQMEQALGAAAAIEMIHTYSLIHDDLPAMDDDDYRRGRLTCHKVYGEAMAILAGDALLTQAFILLSAENPPCPPLAKGGWGDLKGVYDSEARLMVIREIAEAAGSKGMVGGQVVDMLQEDREIDLPTLTYLHEHKTGALIRVCLRVGGILASAGSEQMEALTRYGERIGLAFQIVDDILDLEGSLEVLGKQAGSDLRKKKATFPALLGIEESRRWAHRLVSEAQEAVAVFGDRGVALQAIAEFVVMRRG